MFSLLKEKNLPPVPVWYCKQSAGAFIGFSHSIVDTLIFHFLEKDVVPAIAMEIVAAVVPLPVSTYIWDPVNVPQTTGGLIPAGLVTVTVSRDVQEPIEVVAVLGCLNTAESKSNLTWQILVPPETV